MNSMWTGIAALNGLVSVAAGAFGAHFLKSRLAAEALATFETGVRYQMVHALAIMAAAWMIARQPSRAARASACCFLVGIMLFSGSLYGLSLFEWRWLGPVTPLGGLAFLSGWALLAAASFTQRATPDA
ncbi:MAG: DUF423 domain-containing protein [Phycisphaerae bacterium]